MPKSTAPVGATNLRTEYLVDPLGIDEVAPRFSWWVDDDRPGARQTAYRIRAARSADDLRRGTALLWDTGRVESDRQAHVEYGGPTLTSRQRVHWDVQLWDAAGDAGAPATPAWFETGLLRREDWDARFIGAPLEGTGRHSPPVPMLRRSFDVPGPVGSARLYVTALGLYEATLNGARVGDDWFRPGWTDYDKRLPVQTYDVTALVRPGANAIGAMLGDGWWCGRVAHIDRAMRWGTRPALLAQLEVTLANGKRLVVCTDETWRWHTGPVVASDFLQGEDYDARREITGWDQPGFDDRQWLPVEPAAWPAARLVWSPAPPVRCVREIEPVIEPFDKSYEWGRYARTFDFGQNFTGVVRLRVSGPAGCTLQLRYAEALKPNGTLDMTNLRSARCVDHYTLKGDPAGETYVPRFTFHGFRYVEVSTHNHWTDGAVSPPRAPFTRRTLTGLVLMSDTPETGTFDCDHPLLNRLQQNIQWGQRSNFLEVPTDCPQRDERLGWTGDAQVFAPTAAFNMDVAAFFTKWMRDLDDAQHAGGEIPAIAPHLRDRGDGGPGWSDARVVIPWAMYCAYGDRRMLERHYDSMSRWAQYQADTARDGVRCHPEFKAHQGFGDWLALDGDGIDAGRNATPKDLIGTAYYAYAMGVMARVARTLGREGDAATFLARREEAKAAFNRNFVTPAGRLSAGSQTACLMALAFDLLPEPLRPVVVDRLVGLIRDRNWHLSTGFLGTPLLCPVLTRFGRADVAFKLLLQETYPSWLYPVTIGATTMWERWNSWSPDKGFVEVGMNSLNHYAYGAIGEWIYSTIGGIAVDPEHPGYERVRIAPRVGGGLKRAAATFRSMRGLITTAWELDGERFELRVRIPPNATATITLPDGSTRDVAAGAHAFTCQAPPAPAAP